MLTVSLFSLFQHIWAHMERNWYFSAVLHCSILLQLLEHLTQQHIWTFSANVGSFQHNNVTFAHLTQQHIWELFSPLV